jgi:hypothetical protein
MRLKFTIFHMNFYKMILHSNFCYKVHLWMHYGYAMFQSFLIPVHICALLYRCLGKKKLAYRNITNLGTPAISFPYICIHPVLPREIHNSAFCEAYPNELVQKLSVLWTSHWYSHHY